MIGGTSFQQPFRKSNFKDSYLRAPNLPLIAAFSVLPASISAVFPQLQQNLLSHSKIFLNPSFGDLSIITKDVSITRLNQTDIRNALAASGRQSRSSLQKKLEDQVFFDPVRLSVVNNNYYLAFLSDGFSFQDETLREIVDFVPTILSRIPELKTFENYFIFLDITPGTGCFLGSMKISEYLVEHSEDYRILKINVPERFAVQKDDPTYFISSVGAKDVIHGLFSLMPEQVSTVLDFLNTARPFQKSLAKPDTPSTRHPKYF